MKRFVLHIAAPRDGCGHHESPGSKDSWMVHNLLSPTRRRHSTWPYWGKEVEIQNGKGEAINLNIE